MRCAGNIRGRGAFTLVEVLVAAFLASIILYVVIALLIPAMRISSLGSIRVDLDQRAMLLERHLIRALKSTTRSGVMFLDLENRALLSTHPLEGALSGSRAEWSSSLALFYREDDKISEILLSLPKTPLKAVTLPWEAMVESLPASPRRMSVSGVTQFEVQIDSGPQVDFQFSIEKDGEKVSVSRTVFLVNSAQ